MRLNSKNIIVLGIVNATPDSFSDGGMNDPVEHAAFLLKNGADAVDIGGESTRPGAAEVPEREELARILPVIREIRRMFPDTLISVDTRKAAVAEAALREGADWINDISGGTFQPEIMSVVASAGGAYIAGHTRGLPENMLEKRFTEYPDGVIDEVMAFWRDSAAKAVAAGIAPGKIMVDPGFGFAKERKDNMEMAEKFHLFVEQQPYPVCAGVSRKRFLAPELSPLERGEISSRLEVELAAAGAAVIRTHDPVNFRKYALERESRC